MHHECEGVINVLRAGFVFTIHLSFNDVYSGTLAYRYWHSIQK